MAIDPNVVSTGDWRKELPVLTLKQVTLREVVLSDLGPLVDLLAIGDATRFGIDEADAELAAQQLIERAARGLVPLRPRRRASP